MKTSLVVLLLGVTMAFGFVRRANLEDFLENVNNMDNVAAVAATDADGNVQFWGKLAKGAIRGGIQAAAQHNLWDKPSDDNRNVQFWGGLAKHAIRGGVKLAAKHNVWDQPSDA